MKKQYAFLFAALLSVGLLDAQQLPLSNIYNQNRILFNPGNTGDAGALAGYLNHRKQWMNTVGSPSAQFLGLHSPISDKMALGGLVQNIEQGLMRQTSAQLNYSYQVILADDHKLRFGLGASFIQNYINMADAIVQDPSENGLYNGDLNGYTFNSSFGVVYNWDNLEVGVALPNFIPTRTNRLYPNGDAFNMMTPNFVSHASYKYEFDNNLMLQPMVVMRLAPNSSILLDNWLMIDYKNILWLNLAYRSQTNASFIVGAGTWLTKNINLNYAYEYGNNQLGLMSAGTHEISLGFLFSEKRSESPYNLVSREEKPERRVKKPKQPKEKPGGKKKITIITEGYDSGAENSPELEFRVKPKDGIDKKASEDAALKAEVEDLKKKLDKLLKDDNVSQSEMESEFSKIRVQLNNLLKRNAEGESDAVSKELDDISKQIEALKKKMQSEK